MAAEFVSLTKLGMPMFLFGITAMMYSLVWERLPESYFLTSDSETKDSQVLLDSRAEAVRSQITGVKMQYQCLLQPDLRHLIASTEQIIITMPAKAAGTTLKNFAKQCNKASGLGVDYIDNMLNFKEVDHFDGILSKSFQMPPVISSHIYTLDNLLYLIKNVPRNTLLIYVHREETQRIQSAVNEVVTNWCRRGNGYPDVHLEPPTEDFFDEEDGSVCHVSEKNLIDIGLGEKGLELEIGLGATKLLRCETYNSILEYAPNMVFINYKHANDLQKLISESYCPDLTGSPIKSNVGQEKETQTFVKLNNSASAESDLVLLRDWLNVKQNTLDWALGLNNNATCTANNRIMEDKLFSCENGFLKASVVEI